MVGRLEGWVICRRVWLRRKASRSVHDSFYSFILVRADHGVEVLFVCNGCLVPRFVINMNEPFWWFWPLSSRYGQMHYIFITTVSGEILMALWDVFKVLESLLSCCHLRIYFHRAMLHG